MDADRWEQIGQLFTRAMELTGEDRERFLAENCRDDPALRTEIESLLDAADREGFADRFSDSWLADMVARSAVRTQVPTEVGPYRIIRELGRGGMGTVFLAERTDPQFAQQVALKLITVGMADEEVLNRFLRERQILARLAHRNIARLLDGGLTEAGQPFFAMEYVEGSPIDEFADERTLDIDDRLGLFSQVCQAVQYAHQQLVVHRDIKPSNILVTDDGLVKLLDFGIAKLLDKTGDVSSQVTRTGRRVMTPDFASPEQLMGESIGTASDVYSLGVLLYRLLSGRRPYRFTSEGPHEIARVICEEDPVPPSHANTASDGDDRTAAQELARLRKSDPVRLQRRLKGDLDTIVLKALQKKVDRRFASAGQFLEDIERHLAGLPVQARPDTLVYRASKFVRRHRVGVVSGALIFLLLLAGLAGTAWQAVVAAKQAQRASEERDRAQRESAKSEQVTAYLIDLFAESDPAQARGDTLTARELLDVGAQRIGDYFENQPAARATIMDAVGRIYQNLGLYEQARKLLEEAMTVRFHVFGGDHEDKAESLDHLGVLRYELGDLAEADSLLTAGLAMRRRLYSSPSEALATSLDNLGQLRHDSGDFESADTLYREALAMRRQLLGPEGESIATSLNNLAVLLHDRGEFSEAESYYRQALDMDRSVLGDRHPGIAVDLNNLGRLRYDMGDFEAAAQLFREALDLRRFVLGNEHPDVATSANNLAAVLHETRDLETAEALYREALAIRERSFGRDHPRVAISLNNVASILEEKGDLHGAVEMYEESLRIRQSHYGREHPGVATALHNLGSVLAKTGRVAEAEAHLREAISVRSSVLGPEHPLLAASLHRLGELLIGIGEASAAEETVRRALEINSKALPPRHPATTDARSLLGQILVRRGRFEEAETLLVDSYRDQASHQLHRVPQRTATLEGLIALFESTARPDSAARYRRILRDLRGSQP